MEPHTADPAQELRVVAHDFSNLLGAILNYASFIAEEASAAGDDADQRWRDVLGDAGQIIAAARRGTELTERLRALAGAAPADTPSG